MTAGEAAQYLGRTRKQFRRIQDHIPLAQPREMGNGGRLGWRYYWQGDLDRWMTQAKRNADKRSTDEEAGGLAIDPAKCPERDD